MTIDPQNLIIQNNLVFMESAWYDTVGFILVQDKFTKEYKVYTHKLGGDYNEKYNELQDVKKILAHGSYFPLACAMHIFRHNTKKDYVSNHPELFL